MIVGVWPRNPEFNGWCIVAEPTQRAYDYALNRHGMALKYPDQMLLGRRGSWTCDTVKALRFVKRSDAWTFCDTAARIWRERGIVLAVEPLILARSFDALPVQYQ